MDDEIVCLGCGLIVGADSGWGCACAPPGTSAAPPSAPVRSSPYRAAPEGTPCPRCESRLAERVLHDVHVLECDQCLGLFLERATIERLETPEGRELRLAFPKRARADVDRTVRYLQCAVCQRLMNRENFARMSGVIVDVCKDHGVWFDAGEVNAVIDFVEQGGIERARRRDTAERGAERERLVAERKKLRDAFERAGGHRPAWDLRVPYDNDLYDVARSLILLLTK